MKEPLVLNEFRLESGPHKVLLFHPAVCDTRFPWSRWQQPVPLLQLATALRRKGSDLRLIDALAVQGEEKIPRRLQRQFKRGDVVVNYWRWGTQTISLLKQLTALAHDGWYPDEAFVLCGPPFQWEGHYEAVTLIRRVFPSTRIVLFGHYPTQALSHALEYSGADVLVVGAIQEGVGLPLDLSLYQTRPYSTHLAIGSPDRPIADVLDEFFALVKPAQRKERISQVIFADQDVMQRFPEHVRAVCQAASEQKPAITLHAFRGIQPEIVGTNPDMAALLKRAGFKQLLFTSDLDIPPGTGAWDEHLERYRRAVSACSRAGYTVRTDELVGSICLGRPREDLNEVVMRLTQLAHVAGSVMLLPYQPMPDECSPDLPLEERNGKMYPFAEANGYQFKMYMDVVGLSSLLNAKHRSKTFDFGGEGLISKLVRTSLVTESWRPDASQDRPVTVGWFAKDGKWTKGTPT